MFISDGSHVSKTNVSRFHLSQLQLIRFRWLHYSLHAHVGGEERISSILDASCIGNAPRLLQDKFAMLLGLQRGGRLSAPFIASKLRISQT